LVAALKHHTWGKGPAANVTNVTVKFIPRLPMDRSIFGAEAVTFYHHPRNLTLPLGGPPWSGTRPGEPILQAQRNGPGKPPTARIQGVSGPAAGGEDRDSLKMIYPG